MADVARAAGVSAMTVSYSYTRPERVGAATRERVRAAADELGYAGPDPGARSLRRGSTGALGVVLGETLDYAFDDRQATRFLSGVAAVCMEHGLGMTLVPVDPGDPDEVRVERVRQAVVDGFVVWTTHEGDPVLDAVVATRRPAAVLSGPAVDGVPVVTIDDRAAAAAVAGHVFAAAAAPAVLSFPVDARREEFVAAGLDPATVPYPVTRHRLAGATDWARTAGRDWATVPVGVVARNDREHGRAMTGRLLQRTPRPDAVLAMGDELALGALDAVAAAGLRVPQDVAVSGWDASDAGRAAGLTGVAQSLREQGERCARIVVGDPVPQEPPAWHIEVGRTTR
jgi:DNA-binding LacI/PurR family transcriptional regulator